MERILHAIQDLTPTAGTTVFCEAVRDCISRMGLEASLITAEYYSRNSLKSDIVHVHGLWNLFNVRVMRDAYSLGIPFVVSPHGGLMPRVFKKGRLKKFVFWNLFLKPIMKKAAAIHCTSVAEKAVCEKLGLQGPFVVAPLGVNLPRLSQSRPRTSNLRTVLFLGRLGEEKGLVNLLDAWKTIDHRGWVLKIAGPDWLGYRKILDDKIVAEEITGVEFPGLVQGEAKDKLYREADIFVLPSPMENFSMVVLDALAYGVPVIATKGTPWSELESEHCGWWIDQGVKPLKNALREALSTSTSNLNLLGKNGRALAERKYRWPSIAQSLITCYKEIVK